MQNRFRASVMGIVAVAAAVDVVILAPIGWAQGQKPAASAPNAALKTPWGDPDLQGIWTDETDTPLQRPAKYATQEFFTAAQRAELDKARTGMLDRDRRSERGTAADVSGAYNSVFLSVKHIGARVIVDPPNGRIPPLTPAAEKSAAAEREFRLALLQATDTCKTKSAACSGGKYDPTPSPRRADVPPRYNTATINRQPRSAAASGESCRHRAESRCSTTWAKGKGGNATS
jgi:hypothetical protein